NWSTEGQADRELQSLESDRDSSFFEGEKKAAKKEDIRGMGMAAVRGLTELEDRMKREQQGKESPKAPTFGKNKETKNETSINSSNNSSAGSNREKR
ncbi:hypothetical protein PFISCL1PPCAC_27618, partial [Pristionchus fissidentatus]